MIVDDGTAGLNAQGNPLSAEGCNPLINDLTGKIAVCYRGTCQFGTKALNAQNAGAEGVIIINRDPEAIGMAGGNDGASVTIPVVMLSSVDGAALVNEMQNGDVVVFMGNKLGLYVNDAGTTKSSCMISKYGSIPKDMGDNGYIFDLGMQFANFGSADNDFYAVAAVTGPSGVLYYDSIAPINMLSGDTSFIFPGNATSFAPMTNSVWDLGFHEVVYSIGIIGQTDEDDWDNSIRSDFYVTNDVLSLAREDASSTVVTNSYPQNHTSSYQACVRIQDVYPNTSTGVEGIYFAPYNSGVSESLDGIYLQGEIYEWDDAWQDVSGGWATVTFDVLSAVGDFDWDGTASTVNGEVVYQELNAPVILNDNQRYLVCLNSFANDSIGFGYDNAPDYNANYAIYQQPIGALNIDGATWYTGWTSADAVSLGLKIAYDVNVVELETIEGIVYPNPAIDNLTISLEKGNGNADLIVYDIAGRLVSSNKVNTNSGLINVDLTKYENGNYIFNLNFEDGKTSNFNVVIVK
jgi:hypothetical protein